MQVVLSGWPGAPGVNTFHFDAPTLPPGEWSAVADGLKAAYQSLASYNMATVSYDGLCTRYNVESGAIEDAFNAGAGWTVASVPGANYNVSRATQIKLQFRTATIRKRRFLRGGIYFGPIGENSIDNNGAISVAAQDAVSGAFDGLIDILGARLSVWGRPTNTTSNDGVLGNVVSIGAMPLPAVLRRRRD